MGNKLPTSLDEFERTFQRKSNNLTSKEQFLEMLKSKGVTNSNQTKIDPKIGNSDLFNSLFPGKEIIKESSSGFHFGDSKLYGSNFDKSNVHNNDTSTEMCFYISFDNELPSQKIIVSEPSILTWGWLLSEATRTYEDILIKRKESLTNLETEDCSRRSASSSIKKNIINKKMIVGLKSKTDEFKIAIDYYLTQHDMPLVNLPNNLDLEVHFSNIGKNHEEFLKSIQSDSCHVSSDDFEYLNVIGRGGYSKVIWARKRDSGRLYALKIMNKSDVDQNIISEKIVLNERDIQVKLNGDPFFVSLYWCFQDETHYYLVTELWVGGSLYHLLNTHKALDEDTIRFYASEILVMMEKMHDKNILYRDLKPENILIDINGHLKLADFGLAKIVQNNSDLNDTFCGSPEYMAPEMLFGDTHDSTIDIYTFGCLLHEMVSEFPPHYSKNREKMNKRIMYNNLKLSFSSSKSLKHLIRWCWSKNRELRPKSVEILLKHPFFNGVDWDQVRTRETSPPWVPSLISHFNKKLTKIPIVNNQIQISDSSLWRFDSRTSLYFEKINDDTSEQSIYFMVPEFLKDNEAFNESLVSKCNFRSVKRKDSKVNNAYIQGFEVENMPPQEIVFKEYIRSMIRRSQSKPKQAGQQSTNFEIKLCEVDSINESLTIPEEDYENGTVEDTDETPAIEINSILKCKDCYFKCYNYWNPNSVVWSPITGCFWDVDNETFGPHIEANKEINRKNYESDSYYTPLIESKISTPKNTVQLDLKKTRNNKNLIDYEEESKLNPDRILQSKTFEPLYESVTSHNHKNGDKILISNRSDNFYQIDKPKKLVKAKVKHGIYKIDNWDKPPQKYTKIVSRSFVEDNFDTLKLPSDNNSSIYFVNDLNEVADQNRSPPKLSSIMRKSDQLTSSCKTSRWSAFSKDSLNVKYRRIDKIIHESHESEKSSVHKQNKKLKKNVENFLKKSFGEDRIKHISSPLKSSRF